jgi:hypothetical protein
MRAKPVVFRDIGGGISLWGFDMNTRPPGAFALAERGIALPFFHPRR